MKQVITKSLQDILSKDVIVFVSKIGLRSLALSSLFVWYLWGWLSSFIASYISWIPWEWLQTSGAKFITLGLGYMIFIITISLFTSLYSEKLLILLAKKHYPEVSVVGSANITTSILLTLKASIVFLILFILFIPLLFIPILGQVTMLYLWSILIKEPTIYDVNSLFISKGRAKQKNKKTTIIAMTASLFNYVPLLNIFAPLFAQILFLHNILGEKP